MRKRIKIVVNPFAGRGRALGRAEAVAEHLRKRGCQIEFVKTREYELESDRPDAIVAVGGDGTICELVNRLPNDPPPLGLIPSGTGNALAKEVTFPRSPDKLARIAAEGSPSFWDCPVDRQSGKRFFLFASAGYDSFVVDEFHKWRRGKGRIFQWQYFEWGLKSVIHFTVPRLGVEIDGQRISDAASWVQISNISAYGGPFIYTPDAKPDDGLLDIMVFRGPWIRDLPRIYLRGVFLRFLRTEYPMHDLKVYRGRRVRLWSADGRPIASQFDGDPGPMLPLEVEILPGKIPVLLPPNRQNH